RRDPRSRTRCDRPVFIGLSLSFASDAAGEPPPLARILDSPEARGAAPGIAEDRRRFRLPRRRLRFILETARRATALDRARHFSRHAPGAIAERTGRVQQWRQ